MKGLGVYGHESLCIVAGVINRVTQGFSHGASGLTGKWRSKQSTCTGRHAKRLLPWRMMTRFSPEIGVSFAQLNEMFIE